MSITKLKQIEKKIKEVKRELLELEGLRPGSLVQRYNVCGKKRCRCKDPKNPQKHGPYHLVVYTRSNKRKITFVQPHYLKEIKQQIKSYRKLKNLIDKWIELGLEYSKEEMNLTRPDQPKK